MMTFFVEYDIQTTIAAVFIVNMEIIDIKLTLAIWVGCKVTVSVLLTIHYCIKGHIEIMNRDTVGRSYDFEGRVTVLYPYLSF